ncbi:SapC family protein [Bowmanella dokdonensis]|uniref:SapC family protein n=1 Tax=Bowmanella dokdonensis TaxID=751969 RepID=A0A939IQ48_9ALTE|nr:SapC family protein [Bowmanella dokdonensis]MBN7824237.1 SapC family protein [Bowmanella dokdonensis]
MSTHIVPLNNQVHSHLKVQNKALFKSFAEDHLIPVLLREFVGVAAEFPIIFVKSENTGQFHCVAMMGLKRGQNLYCQGDSFPAGYIPQALRNAPFSVTPKEEGSEELMICIDESHELVNAHEGEALFDEQGEQTEFLKARGESVVRYISDTQMTLKFMQMLLEKDLLVSRDMKISMKNGEEFVLNGIYVIDEQKVNSLSLEDLEVFRSRGLLSAIYAQLFSMQQIHRLTRKYIEVNGDNK